MDQLFNAPVIVEDPVIHLERLMTPEEMARLMQVEVPEIHRLVREGKLTCVEKIGPRSRRFRVSDYENFIRAE